MCPVRLGGYGCLAAKRDTWSMSRASRRDQLRRTYDSLSPEQQRVVVGLGIIYAPAVVILQLVLAVTLSRAVARGWRVRERGLAAAIRAGWNPWLVGLVGAMTLNELVRAVVLRPLIRPALNPSESNSALSAWE